MFFLKKQFLFLRKKQGGVNFFEHKILYVKIFTSRISCAILRVKDVGFTQKTESNL